MSIFISVSFLGARPLVMMWFVVQRGQSITSHAELQSISCPTLVLNSERNHTGGSKQQLARYASHTENTTLCCRINFLGSTCVATATSHLNLKVALICPTLIGSF